MTVTRFFHLCLILGQKGSIFSPEIGLLLLVWKKEEMQKNKQNKQLHQLMIDNGWKVTNFDELKEIKPIKLLVDQLPYDDKSNHLKCESKGRTVRFSVRKNVEYWQLPYSAAYRRKEETVAPHQWLWKSLREHCLKPVIQNSSTRGTILVISNASFGARTANRITVTPEKIVANHQHYKPGCARPNENIYLILSQITLIILKQTKFRLSSWNG